MTCFCSNAPPMGNGRHGGKPERCSPMIKRRKVSRQFRPGAAWFVVAAATTLLLVTGCISQIEIARAKPAQLKITVADGRSPALHSGDHFAYWIWREDDVWHLRTTTARKSRRFQG